MGQWAFGGHSWTLRYAVGGAIYIGVWVCGYGVIIDAKRVIGQLEGRDFGAFTPRLCDIWNYVDNAYDCITIPLPIYELRNWGLLLTQGRNDTKG